MGEVDFIKAVAQLVLPAPCMPSCSGGCPPVAGLFLGLVVVAYGAGAGDIPTTHSGRSSARSNAGGDGVAQSGNMQ